MNRPIKNVLLWIAVLPASLIGMMLTFGLSRIIHNLTAGRYIDTSSWLNILFTEVMSNMIAGAAFVFIGYRVAPNHQKITAVVLTAALILVAGSSFFIVNFLTKQYFSNVGIVSGLIGSIACCISIYQGEFDKGK